MLRFLMHLNQPRLPLFLVEEWVRIVHPYHSLRFAVVQEEDLRGCQGRPQGEALVRGAAVKISDRV
jgi:hypothetical protein